MNRTVPKRTNRLGWLVPGCLAAGTALLVCFAPETPKAPVTASDVAALTRIHDCDRSGIPAGVPGWSVFVVDDDRDSPDDDHDDSPDRDGPDAIVASSPGRPDVGGYSAPLDRPDVVAASVSDIDVRSLRGPPPAERCSIDNLQRPASTWYWSAASANDGAPDSSDDDDDDDDDGPDPLTSTRPGCSDSSDHISSELPLACADAIQRASETRSLRAPPR